MKEPGRNDPCVCGSGLKYKKCCMDEIDALAEKAMRQDFEAGQRNLAAYELDLQQRLDIHQKPAMVSTSITPTLKT